MPCTCRGIEPRPVAPGAYLGERAPGDEPRLFALGIVSTGLAERDLAVTPAGDEIYFGVSVGTFTVATILGTHLEDGSWSPPEVAPFAGRHMDIEPALTPDGSRLYFVSNRPLPGNPDRSQNEDIWFVDRISTGWSDPQPLGPPVNTGAPEFFPSATRDGTLYFTRRGEAGVEHIWRARSSGSGFTEPQRLGPEVNAGTTRFNACVAPDESYVVVSLMGREDSLGGPDYYVAFRSPGDIWSGPFNLGPAINTAGGREWSCSVSPDGRFFFFMSSRTAIRDRIPAAPLTRDRLLELARTPMNGNSDIWWVDTSVIERLRPAATPPA